MNIRNFPTVTGLFNPPADKQEEVFSTEELRRQLGHKRYQPIWEMVCKLQEMMSQRDDKYMLASYVNILLQV